MDPLQYEVEAFQIFSKSKVWQLNRDYYQDIGIEAWSNGIVPHQITSNSLVGKTYASLILGFLKDLAAKKSLKETVYIVELGAGHGRLGYHVLKHLEEAITLLEIDLPPYCYVLTDIVEQNLSFFKEHPQLKPFMASGVLDYAYYDAVNGENIELRYAGKTIQKGDLENPIIAIGNYFFDSIPSELFHVKGGDLSLCSVALHSAVDPKNVDTASLIKNLKLTFRSDPIDGQYYESAVFNEILERYKTKLESSYVFFPEKGLLCLESLKALSSQGLMLLSMDKGFHDVRFLENKKKPEIIAHGSFSVWVNYHAIGEYCKGLGGLPLFPKYKSFHLEAACFLFVENPLKYTNTNAAYQHTINGFGPDNFNSIKKLCYANISNVSLVHLLSVLRLCAYDSTFFVQILPRIKQLILRLTSDEGEALLETLDLVWNYYFNINEKKDLALSIGGIFFDLGYYEKALLYFQYSTDVYGEEMDTFYNKMLCYYQLRQDVQFNNSLKIAQFLFPDAEIFENLKALKLDN